MQKSIRLVNVTKSFDNVPVLKGIDLNIEAGQFLILVGPSGCGKSTLLNCLAGLDKPTQGDIYIGDRLVNDVLPAHRDIAMVFQSYALYPNMDVRENISFGLKIRKVPAAEQQETISRVAKMLQIEHLLERKPGQLSGGQRQRVAMGRALARNPGLFLFDEPLSNLDAKLRVEMRAEIKQLHQRTGITSVYVTHDQIEAMTLGDCIAVMKEGEVQQFGTPLQIYEQPANLFVASFIGSPKMGVLPIEFVHDHSQVNWTLQSGGSTSSFALPTAHFKNVPAGKVLMGIRPEMVTLDATDGLPVQVSMVEHTGPETYVFFDLHGVRCCAVSQPAHAPRIGDVVHISIADTSRLSFFDAVTELRLNAD